MAASNKVLNTYELLEPILLHLPVKDILFAQAVSPAWRTVIQRSENLQIALFRKPISQTRLQARYCDRHDTCVWYLDSEDPDNVEPVLPWGPIVNPFMNKYMLNRMEPAHRAPIPNFPQLREYNRHDIDNKCIKGLGDGEGSWREMLFLQPPAQIIVIFCCQNIGCHHETFNEPANRSDTMYFGTGAKDGVTTGNLIDCLNEHPPICTECQKCSRGPGAEWQWEGNKHLSFVTLDTTSREVLARAKKLDNEIQTLKKEGICFRESAEMILMDE